MKKIDKNLVNLVNNSKFEGNSEKKRVSKTENNLNRAYSFERGRVYTESR